MRDGGFAQSNFPNMTYSKKRGMSTIVSTVLLVGFAIALGLIITAWSGKIIKSNIEKSEERIGTDLECLNVNIKITPGIGTIVFVQNNNLKEVDLIGLISRFNVGNKIFVDYKNQDTKVKAFGVTTLDYSNSKDRNGIVEGGYNPAELKDIEVIPRIQLEDGGVVDCAKKSAIYAL